ncbi:MAG: cell wall-binding repeat-containing protein [Actinomycetota bacterium]|nr:cell wall-binding repeat-containing protein [Actinomycetota bacterium]
MRRSKLSRALLALLVTTTMTFTTTSPAVAYVGPTGGISGTVVNESGVGIPNVKVYKWTGSGSIMIGATNTTTDANGDYSFSSIDDGDYQLLLDHWGGDDQEYAYEYYDDAIDESERTSVAVSGGAVVSSIDATLAVGGTISGRIKNERGEGIPAQVRSYFEPAPGEYYYRQADVADSDGYYQLIGLPTDSYTLRFLWTPDSTYVDEFYDNAGTYGAATEVTLAAGQQLTGYDAVLEYTDQIAPAISSNIATGYVGSASIEITSTDEGLGDSGIYQTYYDLDGAGWIGAATSTVVVNVDQLGEHSITYKAKDNAWNYSEYVTKTFTITRDDAPVGTEIAGTSRYDTALAASQEGYADGSASAVVIATGTNWPDALGGSALAGAIDGPLLLTTPSALPETVEDEITRLGATETYIVGGLNAVGQDVEDSLLTLLGDGNVTRLAGATRYETGDLIAAEVIEQLDWRYDGNAFCTTGGNFPDALAASSVAARLGWPILLTPYGDNPTLPAETSDVTILGGTGAVAEATETWLNGELGDENVDRIGGTTRYETGAQIAAFGIEQGLFWDGVGIAVGDNFPDALSGGAMLGSQGTVLLLTPGSTLSEYAAGLLGDNKTFIEKIRFLGGTNAVSQVVRDQALGAVE